MNKEKYCNCPKETSLAVVGYPVVCVCSNCNLPIKEKRCEDCENYDTYKEITNKINRMGVSSGAPCFNCTRFNTKKDNFKRKEG